MNRRLIIRPEAEADITDSALWYDSRELGLGLQFIAEVHSAIARAVKNPEAFTLSAGVQSFVVFSLDAFLIDFS